MFNAVYTAYMATGEARFREAVEKAIAAVVRTPTYLFDETPPVAWWSANSYSDAIESALVLMNRLPNAALGEQIDVAATKMLDRIRPDGIVEDWHGDGNTIRTGLMYMMWKTQGARLEPWNRAVHLGAVREAGTATFLVEAETSWSGLVRLDHPRHRDHLHLPVNYPRLNEWPEWFAVQHDRRYRVRLGDAAPVDRLGAELVQGVPVTLKAGESLRIEVTDGGEPPYGGRPTVP
jgi:hypothetical protein